MRGRTHCGVVGADPDLILQVISNLLSNAVKFSSIGGEVFVKVENLGTMGRLSVCDQGPGVPDDYKTRIFEKFVQVDAADNRKKGGTGLGLSIVKQLMLRLGGEVGLNLCPCGAAFSIFNYRAGDRLHSLRSSSRATKPQAHLLFPFGERRLSRLMSLVGRSRHIAPPQISVTL